MSLRLEGGTLEEHITSLGDLDAFSAELHVSCLPLYLKPAGLKKKKWNWNPDIKMRVALRNLPSVLKSCYCLESGCELSKYCKL